MRFSSRHPFSRYAPTSLGIFVFLWSTLFALSSSRALSPSSSFPTLSSLQNIRDHANESFRASCVPLDVVSPYQSTWHCRNNLTDAFPQHWSGSTIGWYGMISVDGNVYRWLGPEDGVATEVAQQLGLAQVGATTTNYSFAVYPPGMSTSNGSAPSVLFNVSFRKDYLFFCLTVLNTNKILKYTLPN